MGPLRESRRAAIERLFQHGGDIKAATVAYPDAPRPWIDLSTGLNPVAYPVPELPRELWARLPETAALDALRAAAGLFYGVEPECVAAAAGSQAVLQVLPRLFPAPRVSLLGPTYGEHERVWKTSGADVETVGDLDAATAPQVVVVNPNNPDGRMFSRLQMGDTARRLADEGRRLIVDEAFMDFEAESVAGDRLAATIVLRSFGKAFGLSGLRLGFAVAPPAIAARIREALGPWPVSGPAIAVGMLALADRNWLDAARRRLERDAAWLDDALTRVGFALVGQTRLFRLARHPGAAKTFERLCAQGVLARPFAWDPNLLRFGIPTVDQRPRLREALMAAR
jgi:cobalamin biosynthetic protein CobC